MSWMFWKKTKVELTEDQRAALKRLVAEAKFELIPLDSVMAKCDALPDGAAVTVTASPSHGIEATFDLCATLAARGHDVTPHLSAHMTRDRAHLQALLDQARAANITKVFVVGGDAKDRGSFHDGLHLLQAMDELGHPFTEIGIPSYPEGHADIADDVLLQALKDKQRYATAMTTQMCFNPGRGRQLAHTHARGRHRAAAASRGARRCRAREAHDDQCAHRHRRFGSLPEEEQDAWSAT